MKKIIIFCLCLICLFLSGCGSSKTPDVVSLNKFEEILTDNKFNITNNTEQYTEKVDYIIGARLANLGDELQIEMIEYKDFETAKKVQDGQIESFLLLKSTGAHENIKKGENYYKYGLVSNGRYMVSVRVKNTLVFCKTLLENKEIVDKVIDSMKY